MALKRNIDLRLITDEKQMNVWFDVNMMDKVIFNLLSNAFKFTKDGGYVYVHLQKDEAANQVVIQGGRQWNGYDRRRSEQRV